MRKTFCERLMWLAMARGLFGYVRRECPGIDMRSYRRRAKRIYWDMVERTPDIGDMRDNPLRMSLAGGIVWLSLYEAAEGRMSEEQFAGMIPTTTELPVVRMAYAKKRPFGEAAIRRRLALEKTANAASDSEFNWVTETVPGRDGDEMTINYHQCGLCALGRQEHHENLIPHMCAMDFISVGLMGGVLHRSGTISTGAPLCDFHVVRKGSRWDV